jgi:glutamyl-tRNA synthetase
MKNFFNSMSGKKHYSLKALLYIIYLILIYRIHLSKLPYNYKLMLSVFFGVICLIIQIILRKYYYMFTEKNHMRKPMSDNIKNNSENNSEKINDREYRLRFAPSPTGEMHVGNLRTALFNYLFTKQNEGKFFLRIEDTDVARSKFIYEASIKDTLKWLNIEYEPLIIRQSERFPIYSKIANDLFKKNFVYYCSCEKLDEETKTCPCENEKLTNGVLRFKIPRNRIMTFKDEILGNITVNTNTIENFAILRNDGTPTYNFVVVIDDVELKITHVFRGNEHLYNTFKQLLIYEALEMPMPKFGHFPMINGKDGKKLSKRSGDTSVIKYRESGVVPEALFNFLIRLGWGYGNQEIFSLEEAIKLFNINKISPSPAMFDVNKLMYLCGYYLQLNLDKHFPLIITYMEKKLNIIINDTYKDKIKRLMGEFAKRVKLINELGDSLLFIFPDYKIEINKENIKESLLTETIRILETVDENNWKEIYLNNLMKEKFPTEMKDICGNIRWILLNMPFSPSIFLILEVLGKEESLKRLKII